jgi:von Willebrand factor type A domain
MRTRHRLPTLVSMWMLDVFCCALGCVILLLLLKSRESGIIAEEAAQANAALTDTQAVLVDAQSRNTALGADIADREGKLALLNRDFDETARTLAVVRTERDALAKNLAAVEEAIKAKQSELLLARKKLDAQAKLLALSNERSTLTDEELAKQKAIAAELAKKADTTQKSADDLAVLVRENEKQRAEANARIVALEAKLKTSAQQIDDLTAKSAEIAKLRTKVTELEKQIADANVTIVDLQGNKAKLADRLNKLEIESDQRFAGIALTGKNVVFLVDMSGSMDRTDENTVAPTKWPTVRDTLLKVMRSLPDLEQFQVIIFSSKASYLLGSQGEWLPYRKEKSIENIHKAMTATKPVGDTNLYLALEEAFKFRPRGLDTVYLFSDGLPTSGPGLTATEEQTLGENERGVILARYLRRLLKTNWNRPLVNQPRVRINSVGFFYESPDVGAFLWALSRDNDGSFVGMSKP